VTRSGEDAIRVALAAWLAGGSAVLLIDVDDAETERLVDVERARLA
jgi:hypothetical protein